MGTKRELQTLLDDQKDTNMYMLSATLSVLLDKGIITREEFNQKLSDDCKERQLVQGSDIAAIKRNTERAMLKII